MATFRSLASATLLLASAANAHFTLTVPPSFGFDEDKEASAPCGGFTPSFDDKSKVSDFHVGGNAIGVKSGHAQTNWLFRATLESADTKNWTQLFPIVQQSGLGLFCEPSVVAPEAWAGKQGIVSVVANAPDGILYQCAAVNFVSGTGASAGDACKNGTASISFVSDPDLSGLVSGGSGSSSGGSGSPNATGSSGTGTSTTPSATPSSTKNAAAGVAAPASLALVGLLGFAML